MRKKSVTKAAKYSKMEEPKLVGYSFYHKGTEYVIQAENQDKARTLFNELISKK